MEFQEKFEPFNEKVELRKEYLEKFIDFRDNYIDDLPLEKVEHNDENYHFYKCRGNFFQAVIADIDNMINEGGVINNLETIDKYKEFFEHVSKIDFSKLVVKEDIDKVNEIINCVIKSVQDKS